MFHRELGVDCWFTGQHTHSLGDRLEIRHVSFLRIRLSPLAPAYRRRAHRSNALPYGPAILRAQERCAWRAGNVDRARDARASWARCSAGTPPPASTGRAGDQPRTLRFAMQLPSHAPSGRLQTSVLVGNFFWTEVALIRSTGCGFRRCGCRHHVIVPRRPAAAPLERVEDRGIGDTDNAGAPGAAAPDRHQPVPCGVGPRQRNAFVDLADDDDTLGSAQK